MPTGYYSFMNTAVYMRLAVSFAFLGAIAGVSYCLSKGLCAHT